MMLIFVSGPYRADTAHGIVENIRRAEAVAIECWRKGWAVICPHKNTALLDGVLPDHVWLKGDLEMLSRCDAIVMMDKWLDSEGAVAEHECAVDSGLHIFYGAKDVPKLRLPEQG